MKIRVSLSFIKMIKRKSGGIFCSYKYICMYGGFDVFKVYLVVKLHFTTNYDYFEYDGKVNCKLETFTKEMTDIFFTNLVQNTVKIKYLIFLLLIFVITIKSG